VDPWIRVFVEGGRQIVNLRTPQSPPVPAHGLAAAIRHPLRAALLAGMLLGLLAGGCTSEQNGGPRKEEKQPASDPATEAREAYDELRRRILDGEFTATWDFSSRAYREATFPVEQYRRIVASSPGLKALGLDAGDVARMEPRAVIKTYFEVLPEAQKKELVLAMAGVDVIGQKRLPDGRVAVRIRIGRDESRVLWVKEDGSWKMDGQEKRAGGGG